MSTLPDKRVVNRQVETRVRVLYTNAGTRYPDRQVGNVLDRIVFYLFRLRRHTFSVPLWWKYMMLRLEWSPKHNRRRHVTKYHVRTVM